MRINKNLVFNTSNGEITMLFFNPEETEKTFKLFINGNSKKIMMKKYEILTVKYKDEKFNIRKKYFLYQMRRNVL